MSRLMELDPRVREIKISVASFGCFAVLALLVAVASSGCGNTSRSLHDAPLDTGFDSNLAERLGADQYGMRTYVMAFLKAGPNRDHDAETARDLQAAHMANIRRLADEGTLVLAGPFIGDGEYRGIFLFDVQTIEEARQLTLSDPAVQAGRLSMDLQLWYGSAALMLVNDYSRRIAREVP